MTGAPVGQAVRPVVYAVDWAPLLVAGARRLAEARGGQAIGAAGEGIVEVYHAVARASGVADLFKVPTPTARREGAIVYAKKSVTDYVGVLLGGSGKHVAEEVKTISEWPLAMSVVKSHQRGYLDRTVRAGGVGVLTIVGPVARVYVIPWSVARGLTSVDEAKAREWICSPESYLRGAGVEHAR